MKKNSIAALTTMPTRLYNLYKFICVNFIILWSVFIVEWTSCLYEIHVNLNCVKCACVYEIHFTWIERTAYMIVWMPDTCLHVRVIHCVKHSLRQTFTASNIHCVKHSLRQTFTASNIHCVKHSLRQTFTASVYLVQYNPADWMAAHFPWPCQQNIAPWPSWLCLKAFIQNYSINIDAQTYFLPDYFRYICLHIGK